MISIIAIVVATCGGREWWARRVAQKNVEAPDWTVEAIDRSKPFYTDEDKEWFAQYAPDLFPKPKALPKPPPGNAGVVKGFGGVKFGSDEHFEQALRHIDVGPSFPHIDSSVRAVLKSQHHDDGTTEWERMVIRSHKPLRDYCNRSPENKARALAYIRGGYNRPEKVLDLAWRADWKREIREKETREFNARSADSATDGTAGDGDSAMGAVG